MNYLKFSRRYSIVSFSLWFVALLLMPCFAIAGPVVTDMAGRKVTVPEKIDRIVAISGALRLIVYLDATDKVVGLEGIEKRMEHTAMRPYSLVVKDRIDHLPVISEGGPGKLPDFEALIRVRPQLIITADPNVANAEIIQKKTNIPVLLVSYGDIGSLDAGKIKESIRLLGKVLDKPKRAEDVRTYIDKILSDLKKRTVDIEDKKRVYVGGVSFRGSQGIKSTQGLYLPIEWVNAINVASVVDKKGAYFIDKEQLISWNPDLIFLDSGGLNIIENEKKQQSLFKALKAFQDKKVFVTLPFNSYYTNIEYALCNGYFIGKTIYPDRFKDIDIMKKTDEIVRFMIGKGVIRDIAGLTRAFKGYE